MAVDTANREQLGAYAWGVKYRFDTVEKLLSPSCAMLLKADFRSFAYSTDLIERLNAEFTAGTGRRGPARGFARAFWASLVRQALVVHRAGGGCDPLSSKGFRKPSLVNTVVSQPLVIRGSGSSLFRAARPALQDEQPSSSNAASSSSSLVVAESGGFELPHEVVVQNTCLLPSQLAQLTHHEHTDEDQPSKKRVGLSPYMLELNKTLADRKRQKQSKLTFDDMQTIREDFRSMWEEMSDKSSFKDAFDLWTTTPKVEAVAPVPRYCASFGCGCVSAPFTPEEFHKWHQARGWPTQAPRDQTKTKLLVVVVVVQEVKRSRGQEVKRFRGSEVQRFRV